MKLIIIIPFILLISSPLIAEEDVHNHQMPTQAIDKHDNEEPSVIKLAPAQIKQVGLETEVIKLQPRLQVLRASGTVAFNAYKLADVTTLVAGAIQKRYVRLGDTVKEGQKLVTITSSELAQAEAGYLRAEAEHRKSKLDFDRLESLVKEKIVSQSRFQQVSSVHQAAHANLAAARAGLASYGLSKETIDSLIKSTKYGQLTLQAPSPGTVLTDDFRIGQHIAAGTRLMQIVDESTVWIELKLSQAQIADIHVGQSAIVTTKYNKTNYPAKVINVYHQLDTATRTVGVRLIVENQSDDLHPGMFVSAEIKAGHGNEKVLLVPAEAVQRQGSELIVFVEEEPGHFERREVEVGKTSMGMIPVLQGVQEGESVVIKGAFSLASELAKSGFAVHNH